MHRWIKGTGAAGCLAVVMVLSHGAQAQNAAQKGGSSQAAGPTSLTPGMQLLLSRLQVEAALDDYLRVLRFEFVELDADANGKLNQTDIDLHETIEATPFRASAINTIMSFDLDGDNVVTEDEIRIVMRYNARVALAATANPAATSAQGFVSALRQVENSVRTVMERDTDKDGKLTYDEVSKSVGRPLQPGGNHNWSARVKQVQTLNSDPGGEVTLASFLSAAEALFGAVDTDGDGKMSQQEIIDYWRAPTALDAAQQAKAVQSTLTRAQQAEANRQKARFPEPARPGCAMPQPSPQAKILLLSSYRLEALSTVSIGDPSIVVHAGRVIVEPGDEPLYVVIPAPAATIWQFSGAVDRIERLVMNSPVDGTNRPDQNAPPAVGATGLPQDRIAFLGKPDCITHFFELPSLQSSQAVAAVRKATGQEPFKAFAAYSVMGFSIPSGKIDSLADRRRQMLTIEKGAGTLRVDGTSNLLVRAAPSKALNDLYNNLPGGLIEIDPKSVVSSFPVQTYEVFPQQAGLVQLLESGALKLNRTGEYIVQKKMRFPAGLFGISVKFLVPHGAPAPDGDPGHACVTMEDATERTFRPCG